LTDQELDAQFAALRDVPPPEALTRDTHARVLAEIGPAPRRRVHRVALAVFAAAAALVLALLVPSAPPQADPAALVPKGAGEVVPTLDLRVAVRHGANTERFSAGSRYAAGDTLLFRVSASAPMTLRLSRNGADLWHGPVPSGDTDLPVGYTLEAGEGAATFVVEGEGARALLDVPAVTP
jgi:hypothetical protein